MTSKVKMAISHLKEDKDTWFKIARKYPKLRNRANSEAMSDLRLIKKLKR